MSGVPVKGRFQPGQSGNPAGRPKGASKAAEARALLLEAVPDAIATLRGAAKAGDVKAAAELLRFALPPFKPVEAPLPVDLKDESRPTERVREVLTAMLGGELSPEQASDFFAALEAAALAMASAKTTELFGGTR